MSAQTHSTFSLNFTRESEFEKSYLGAVLLWVTNTGKHVIIIVNFVLIAAFLSRFYFDRILSDLNESIKVKSEILKQNAPFEKRYLNLQKKIADATTIISQSDKSLARFLEIAAYIPEGVKISNIQYGVSSLSFAATVSSRETLNILLKNLSSVKSNKKLEVKNLVRKNGKDQTTEIQLSMELNQN